MYKKKLHVSYGLAVLPTPAFAMTSGIEHNKKSIISEHFGFTDALIEPKEIVADLPQSDAVDSYTCPYGQGYCTEGKEPCPECFYDNRG